jgi:hypothetical protein
MCSVHMSLRFKVLSNIGIVTCLVTCLHLELVTAFSVAMNLFSAAVIPI